MTGFGSFLKELRGERSLREMEKITGLSHTYLSSLEKGVDPRSGKERKPTPTTLKLLSETLQVDYSKLMKEVGYLPKEKNQLTIGEYIKQERKRKNLSSTELAKRSDSSQPYLSQIENNRVNPPKPKMLKQIAIGLSENEGKSKMHYSALMELAGYESEKREYSSTDLSHISTDLSHISTDDLLAEIKRRMK